MEIKDFGAAASVNFNLTVTAHCPGINVSVTKCSSCRYLLMTGERTLTTSWASFTEDKQPSETKAANLAERLEEDARWHLARRIAGSKGFVKSKFLASFVLYVCEKYLLDQAGEITEQQIGEQVFRRPRGYNPGEDNIVRNYARLLRQRLEEYFDGEGIEETIRIVVPRGRYVPLFIEEDMVIGESKPNFSPAEAVSLEFPSHLDRMLPQDQSQPFPFGRSSCALRALCTALFIALFFVSLHDIHFRPKPSMSDRFWSAFFSPTRDTLLVPADSGLVIYQNLTKRRG